MPRPRSAATLRPTAISSRRPPTRPSSFSSPSPARATAPDTSTVFVLRRKVSLPFGQTVSIDHPIEMAIVDVDSAVIDEGMERLDAIVDRLLANNSSSSAVRFRSSSAPQESDPNNEEEENPEDSEEDDTPRGPIVPATITGYDGMQTRKGWGTFLTFEVNGKKVRHFGRSNELKEMLSGLGYHYPTLRTGTRMTISCRVILGRTDDDQYTTVAKVLPGSGSKPRAA